MTNLVPATAKVEAVLLVSPRPVSLDALAFATDIPKDELETVISSLGERYSVETSGIVLRSIAGGYQLATNPVCADTVERFREETRPAPLSNAAHEVLSCALYLGPLTRAAVSAVRGVNSDAVVRGLLERGLLAEVGADRDSPGAPALLDVTDEFLAAAGASSREDFPTLDSLVEPEDISRVRERVGASGDSDVAAEHPRDTPESA